MLADNAFMKFIVSVTAYPNCFTGHNADDIAETVIMNGESAWTEMCVCVHVCAHVCVCVHVRGRMCVCVCVCAYCYSKWISLVPSKKIIMLKHFMILIMMRWKRENEKGRRNVWVFAPAGHLVRYYAGIRRIFLAMVLCIETDILFARWYFFMVDDYTYSSVCWNVCKMWFLSQVVCTVQWALLGLENSTL